jgi:hypothetical protein
MENKKIKSVTKPIVAIVLVSLMLSSCSVTYRERHRRPPPPPKEKVIIVH